MNADKMNADHIILFDGVCNLCNSSVNFVIKHDKQNRYKFAAIQSESGQNILKNSTIHNSIVDSIVLIENNQVYLKSSAALRIAKHLDGLYPLLSVFLIVPPFIRNWVYDLVAQNRYTWFGKSDSCMIPSKETRAKFIS